MFTYMVPRLDRYLALFNHTYHKGVCFLGSLSMGCLDAVAVCVSVSNLGDIPWEMELGYCVYVFT